jgi:hypothetical protein
MLYSPVKEKNTVICTKKPKNFLHIPLMIII